jgi:adenosylhomocysteine nucleosidase
MILKTLIANWLREQAKTHVIDTIRDSLEQPVNAASREPSPPCELVVLFASAVEAGGTVDSLKDRVTMHCASHVEHSGGLNRCRTAVIESGHGQQAMATAALEAIQLHHPRWLICAGFASALVPDLRRGHILMATEIVDTSGQSVSVKLHLDQRSLENNRGLHLGRLLTADHLVRSAVERRQLAETHSALACDLESWGAAEACRQAGVRFLSVRIMTEAADDELPPDVETLLHQRTAAAKLGAAAGSVWRRPSVAKDLWRFNEGALKASDRLSRFLSGLLQNLPK